MEGRPDRVSNGVYPAQRPPVETQILSSVVRLLRLLRSRWIGVGVLVLARVTLLAASADLAEPAAAAAGSHPPIVIGVSCVQTGPAAALGQSLLQGSQAYFDRVNQRGGVRGRKIQLLIKDDGYEPDPAVQNTREFIFDDRVFFLFDYIGTPTLTRVLPLLRYYQEKHIVNVAPFTGAEPQRKPPYASLVFNIRASYEDETRLLVNYLVSRGLKRIGFLGQADAYGKSGELGVTRALLAHGLVPSGIVTYRRNQKDRTSMGRQVEILRARGADAVICVGVYGPCADFIREARTQRWEVPIANVSFVGALPLIERLRQDSKESGLDLTAQLLCSQVVPCSTDVNYPLVRDFQEHFGPHRDPKFIALEGWLNAAVVTEALGRIEEPLTREKFSEAMESLGGWDPGLGIPLGFSKTNHLGLTKIWLTKTEAGSWVPEATEVARP